jgi:glyoxylase-like metal-dependent hydrolase (beta-lactamase superfamily II)
MSTDFHGYGKVKVDLCALKNRKVNAQRTLTHRLHSPGTPTFYFSLFTFYWGTMRVPPFTPVKFDLLKVGHCAHPECIAMRGGGWGSIEFPALVGLIEHPREGLILYDTGYSRHFFEATRRPPECLYRMVTPVRLTPEEELLGQLESRGIAASDIGLIVISHFHADHIAGLRDFPTARFFATRAEHAANEKRSRVARVRRAYLRGLLPVDFEARSSWVENGATVPAPWPGFRAGFDLLGDGSIVGIDLPGHTASQLGLAFRTEVLGDVFLVGDACWKIEGLEQNRPPARLAYSLFANGEEYDATFAALRELAMSEAGPVLIPSHCATTWAKLGGTRHIDHA